MKPSPRAKAAETVAKPAPSRAAIAGISLDPAAAALSKAGAEPDQLFRPGALHLDRAGERAGAVGAGAAAAGHPDPAEPARIVSRPGNPAAERIGSAGTPSSSSSARLEALPPSARKVAPWLVGLAERASERRNCWKPAMSRRMSSSRPDAECVEPLAADLGHVIAGLARAPRRGRGR